MLHSVSTVSFFFMWRRGIGNDRYRTIRSPTATSRFPSQRADWLSTPTWFYFNLMNGLHSRVMISCYSVTKRRRRRRRRRKKRGEKEERPNKVGKLFVAHSCFGWLFRFECGISLATWREYSILDLIRPHVFGADQSLKSYGITTIVIAEFEFFLERRWCIERFLLSVSFVQSEWIVNEMDYRFMISLRRSLSFYWWKVLMLVLVVEI